MKSNYGHSRRLARKVFRRSGVARLVNIVDYTVDPVTGQAVKTIRKLWRVIRFPKLGEA